MARMRKSRSGFFTVWTTSSEPFQQKAMASSPLQKRSISPAPWSAGSKSTPSKSRRSSRARMFSGLSTV